MGSFCRHLPNMCFIIMRVWGGENLNCPYLGHFLSNEVNFFSYALVLTEFLGSGGIYKKILRFDVSRGLRSQKTPILSHFTREFGQKLWAIALRGGGHHSKIKNFITDHLQMYQTFDSKCKIPGTSNFFFMIFL